MLRSQNGWPILTRAELVTVTVPGTNVRLTARPGDVAVCLQWWASRWNLEVEPIEGGVHDDWGWAPRPVRGQTVILSNHGSGTAWDLDATQHPRGVSIHKTFTRKQIKTIRKMLRDALGVLRWGGFYVSAPPDGMHVEINAGSAAVARLAKRIRKGKVPGSWVGFPGPHPKPPEKEPVVHVTHLRSDTDQDLTDGQEVDVLWDGPNGYKPSVQAVAGATALTAVLHADGPADATIDVAVVEVDPKTFKETRQLGGAQTFTAAAKVDLQVAAVTTSTDRLRLRVTAHGAGVKLTARFVEVHTQEAS